MPNIKFNYLYRDGANYKNYGFVIFSNPGNISIDLLLKTIKLKLIDETWFYANQWNLPELYFSDFNPNIDPTWHEFESIAYTKEAPAARITLTGFISRIQTN